MASPETPVERQQAIALYTAVRKTVKVEQQFDLDTLGRNPFQALLADTAITAGHSPAVIRSLGDMVGGIEYNVEMVQSGHPEQSVPIEPIAGSRISDIAEALSIAALAHDVSLTATIYSQPLIAEPGKSGVEVLGDWHRRQGV